MRELRTTYEKESGAKAKLRLLAAIKRKEGESIDAIAASIGKPRRTVHGWLHRFEQRGLGGAEDKKQSGRPPRLKKKQLLRLKADLLKGPQACGYPEQLWSRRLVQTHARREFGVSYTEQHMRRLLHRLGFTCQKPRQRHYKSAPEGSQKHFKKRFAGSSKGTGRADSRSTAWTRAQ
jgi:transposase